MTFLRSFSTMLLLAVLVGVAPAAAQDPDAPAETDEEMPLRGSNRALSFSLDNLSLGALDGGVGGKLWLSPNTALRTSLNLRITSDEDVTGDAIDAGRSAVSGRLSFLVEWHSEDFGRVSPYLGSGFAIGAGASSQTTDFATGTALRQSRQKGSNLLFSVHAALGAEVRISRRVSLAGEHLFGATVSLGDEERTEVFVDAPSQRTVRDVRSFTVGTGTSSLILSIYF